MLESSLSAPAPIVKLRHEHAYTHKAVGELFRKIEGGRAWWNLTQGTDRAGYNARLQAYHRDVILTCPNRTEAYVKLHDHKLVNYGCFLLN